MRVQGFPQFLMRWLTRALACAALAGGVASAAEVWMPETGEVELEQPPADTVQGRLRHAYALVGAGRWRRGIAEMRELIEQNPDAEWTGEARLMIGRALIASGEYEDGFEHLDELRSEYRGAPLAEKARALQHRAAGLAAVEDLGDASRMYDRLAEAASEELEIVEALKEKADALFDAGRYLRAQGEYLAVVDHYPRGEWAPYCWYRIAECEWEVAEWLGLGLEGVQEAGRAFSDFVEFYPRHSKADEAAQKVKQARQRLAAMNADIVRFYVEAEKRPWAAISYLEYIGKELADTSQGEWSAEEIGRIEQGLEAPPRGRVRSLPLPGVELASSEG